LSTSVLIGYAAQAVLGIAALILLFVAVFFVFSDSFGFGGTKTSIGMFLGIVLFWVGAVLWTANAKRRTIDQAEHALRSRRLEAGMNAPFLKAGLELGRRLGWKRTVPAVLAVFAATGVAAEWTPAASPPR
jgi:hypothetical protein